MKNNQSLLLFLLLIINNLNAQNNVDLQVMADQDQKERMTGGFDWKAIRKNDSLRRVKVFEFLAEDKITTAQDHLNAGIIMQHGNDTIASKMAVTFFEKAIRMDSLLNRWWYAAAVDRDLMRRNKPQIYGTQYITVKDEGGETKTVQYKIDTTQVTDKQREYYYVPTIAMQRKQNKTLNLESISFYYDNNKGSIESIIALIKSEYNKGQNAKYNVSEDMINRFGYHLVNSGELEKALNIFKLSTKLYPDAANTYDSYGECLL